MLTFRNVNILLLVVLIIFYWLATPWWSYVIIFGVHGAISYWGTTQIHSQFHMPAYCNLQNHFHKEIAITFDDGILVPAQTSSILDILNKYKVPAAFFCIGKNLESNIQKDVLIRIDNEGHLIGNHSYSHANTFDFWGKERILKDLNRANKHIQTIIGKAPLLWRPPYGITTPNIAKAIQNSDFKTIGWSVRSLDTVIKNEQKLLKRVCSQLKNGDIVLFHDHLKHLPSVLDQFLEYVLNEGYTVKRVDELLQLKPYKEN